MARRSRTHSSSVVFRYIWHHSGTSVDTIVKELDVPRPTVYRLVSELVDEGLIQTVPQQLSKVGRKTMLYSINASYRYVLGLNLDKLYIKTFVADLTGKIIVNWFHSLAPEQSKEEILAIMNAGINAVLGVKGGMRPIYIDRIGIISLGATASIASDGETIQHFNSQENLNGFNIVQYMQNKFGVKTVLAKSSTLRTLDYLQELGGKGIRNYVYVYIGTGIGAGVVIDGKYYKGVFGGAGEFARAPVGGDANRTLEGSYSQVRLYENITQYLQSSSDLALKARLALLDDMEIESNQRMMRIADTCLQYGDKKIRNIVEAACGEWGRLCEMIAAFYDPQMLIIGGEVNSWTPNIYNKIRENFSKPNNSQTEMMPARPVLAWDELVVVNALEPLMESLANEAGMGRKHAERQYNKNTMEVIYEAEDF